MSIDSNGKFIRFSHCPWLGFPSMQYAFDYFQAQAKLHNQRVIQHGLQSLYHAGLGLQAGQLAGSAVQQALLGEALSPMEPAWETDTPLKQTDAQSIASLRTPLSRGLSEFQYQHAAKPYTQNQRKDHNPVRSSSRSSPFQPPPQTLFAESTPHASEIRGRSRLGLPRPSKSRRPKDKPFVHSLSSTTLFNSHYHQSTRTDSAIPRDLINVADISDQPPNLPSSYGDTILPQTLHKKDRRILGVPASADIEE